MEFITNLIQDNAIVGTVAAAVFAAASFYIAHTETKDVWWYKAIEFVALNYGKAKDKP